MSFGSSLSPLKVQNLMTKLYQQSSLLNKCIWGNPTSQFYLATRILKNLRNQLSYLWYKIEWWVMRGSNPRPAD